MGPSFLVLLLLSVPCTRGGNDSPPVPVVATVQAASAASASATRYSARGVVRTLETEKQTVWIAHQDIPGYMKAMTMPFRAAAALLADLHAGDSVEFSFHDDGDGNLIVDSLRKSQ